MGNLVNIVNVNETSVVDYVVNNDIQIMILNIPSIHHNKLLNHCNIYTISNSFTNIKNIKDIPILLNKEDTIVEKDTIFQKDTIVQKDITNKKDTIVEKDTIVQKDTIVEKDTINKVSNVSHSENKTFKLYQEIKSNKDTSSLPTKQQPLHKNMNDTKNTNIKNTNIKNTNNTNNTIKSTKNDANTITLTTDPKSKYRQICMKYLNTLKQIEIPSIQMNLSKEAVLVEFRMLNHLETLVRNAIYNLGCYWSYTIVCGSLNCDYIHDFCKTIHPNIKIIKIDCENITQNEYNNLLLKSEFWDLFFGEKILIYQEDTLMFNKNIEPFLQYDYVGAPFGPESVTPINVGNGGLSLRSKSIMKNIIQLNPPSNFKTKSNFVNKYKKTSKLDMYPEDVYFSQSIQDLALGKVCPYDIARNFSSEQVFTEDCFGMHCLWFCNKQWETYINEYFKRIDTNNNYIETPQYNFQVYFIHCKDFIDRESLIEDAIREINTYVPNVHLSIKLFEGIDTRKCSLDVKEQELVLKQYDKNLCFEDTNQFAFYKPGQIGAYLSHHLIIKELMDNNMNEGHTIIFEDDIVVHPNFVKSVVDIIHNLEKLSSPFDIIYLSYLNINNGKQKYNNIYNINKNNWIFGAHSLLINNKSVKNIYKHNCTIYHEIDNQYKTLINKDVLKGYYIYPRISHQNRSIQSYIGFHKNNYIIKSN
jgi:GR25 family glycosyltransferase involved in LPS biosynthesis